MLRGNNAFHDYMEEVNNAMKNGYGGSSIRNTPRYDGFSSIRSKESPVKSKYGSNVLFNVFN